MIEMRKILSKLSKQFPKSIAKQYNDFVGNMVGKMPGKVQKILLCLDLDETIFSQIEKFKPDVIITHHPFFYGSKTKILKEDVNKKNLHDKLLKMNIAVYSYHTNFDGGKGGMNDALIEKLGVLNAYSTPLDACMRIGYLPKQMDINDFVKYVKDRLNVSYGLLINEGKNTISKIGIIGGGGSRDYKIAKDEGCDIYISGDVSHHVRREIVLSKFNYLDIPHEVERIFMPTMKNILLSIDSSLDILIVDHEKEPTVI